MHLLARCLSVAVLAGVVSAARAGATTRFVLVDRLLIEDSAPDSHFHPDASSIDRFASRFDAAFPGQTIHLGPSRLLAADETAVIIVPRITAARLSHEVAAGTIYKYHAAVIGDVSAVDPWTGATLFAATRMEIAEVKLGKSEVASLDSDLTDGFAAATDRWTAACLQELRGKLSPFQLRGESLAVPDSERKTAGGAWPFGSDRGVRRGMVLTGTDGRVTHVTAAFRSYAAIEDATDPSRPIPAGEPYFTLLVRKPSDRPEPRVSLSWSGASPAPPPGLNVKPLSVDAMTDLFGNYLSKTSGLRILPPQVNDQAVNAQVTEMTENISRFAGLAKNNYITLHRESLLEIAKENPEYRVALLFQAPTTERSRKAPRLNIVIE